jgi:hypothetical protein
MTTQQFSDGRDRMDSVEDVQGYMLFEGPSSTTLPYNPFAPILPGPTILHPKPLRIA